MVQPFQIVFHGMRPSPFLSQKVRELVYVLAERYPRVVGVRVVFDRPHRHHRKGNLYSVRVDVRIPGKQLIVSRAPDEHKSHFDMHVALHDAFDELYRELSVLESRRRSSDRHRLNQSRLNYGRVIRKFDSDQKRAGFGFIQCQDGREVYFNSKSVIDQKFNQIRKGTKVRFSEEQGTQGPQASSVYLRGQAREGMSSIKRKAS